MTPHKCPVCDGGGAVDERHGVMYEHNVTCPACNGSGTYDKKLCAAAMADYRIITIKGQPQKGETCHVAKQIALSVASEGKIPPNIPQKP